MKIAIIPEIEIEGWYLEEILGGQFILQVKTSPLDKTFDGDSKREISFMERLRQHNVNFHNEMLSTNGPLNKDDIIDAACAIYEEIGAHNNWVRVENNARERIRNDVYAEISDLFDTTKELNRKVL